jgi:predicted lipid-binding transport protein (Tim44 family)
MRRLAPFLLAASLAVLPALAEARPGLGGSMGSRGSMTYSAPPATRSAPYGASPVQRSLTPEPNRGFGGYSYGGSYGMSRRSGFTSGLLGGFLGAGLAGMLFGHGFWGGGGLGGLGFLGFLLQLVLLYFLVRWLFRMFTGGRPVLAGMAPGFARGMDPNAAAAARPGFGVGGGAPSVAIGPADYQAFERVLHDVQGAWSAQDMTALQAVATPEMVGYFNEQLSDLSSRGLRNTVSGVQLMQGDLSQAWSEGGRDYATVSMRFSMIDVTRDQAGQVVDGSPTERQTVTEFWTFLRSRGGRWVLSAIQQAR